MDRQMVGQIGDDYNMSDVFTTLFYNCGCLRLHNDCLWCVSQNADMTLIQRSMLNVLKLYNKASSFIF